MREGQSAKYVALVKNDSDTINKAFLDLQPELWNPDRTILTLWLDPGRIKRDLQPNKKLGAPLLKNGNYRVVVSSEWQDESGNALSKSVNKTFVTAIRDSLPPDPTKWKIEIPKAGTLQALKIDARESLDHALLQETVFIKNQKGENISGKWQIIDKERKLQFQPVQNWNEKNYTLIIETRLEDMAGNNLNRPFDRDITKVIKVKSTSDIFRIPFSIRD
jgi:hypothetical protein